VLGRVRHDDHVGTLVSSDLDRDVGRETAVYQEAPVDPLRGEEERYGNARPDRLGQVSRREDHGLPGRQIRGDCSERDRQRVEVAAGQKIAPEHRGVHQGVDLRLDDGRALEVEAALPLLPQDERLESAERAGRLRLIAAEQLAQRQRAGEGIELPAGVTAGVERPDNSTHTRPYDEVRADTQAVEGAEHADVGNALGASTGEH
jgi:hypothetical protein